MPNSVLKNQNVGIPISIKDLDFYFEQHHILKEINLTLERGQVIALLGPSGCGKTTLLKLIAGLEKPTSGSIYFSDQLVADKTSLLPPQKRQLGMVFQDYAIWPHMSVFENIAFPLQMKGYSRHDIQTHVNNALEQVNLSSYAKHKPSELSGGQQQRIALARAISSHPALLLFDEPLSNLDRNLRENLCADISLLLRKLGTSAIYVTHDHEEACIIADKIAVMFAGKIIQLGTPQQLWEQPANLDVARFLKLGNFVAAQICPDGILLESDDTSVESPMLNCKDFLKTPHVNGNGFLLIPENAISIHTNPSTSSLSAQMIGQHYVNGQFRTWLKLTNGIQLKTMLQDKMNTDSAISVNLHLDSKLLRWFPTSH